MLRSASSLVILGIAVVMILAEFGVALGPILASAGIVGVALGFGAQSLVRDFLSGMFMLLEDQYGVGDIVDLGTANGTVEAVGLRITTVRDGNGTVWYVRNGEILRVGNKTQGYAVAVADVPLALGADIGRATEVAAPGRRRGRRRTRDRRARDRGAGGGRHREGRAEGVTSGSRPAPAPASSSAVQRALITALAGRSTRRACRARASRRRRRPPPPRSRRMMGR